MKINIDSTWGAIEDAKTGEKLIFWHNTPHRFNKLLKIILSPSQLDKQILNDTSPKLSKKRAHILYEVIKGNIKIS